MSRIMGLLVSIVTVFLIILLATALFMDFHNHRTPPIFSVKNMLDSTWKNYVKVFVVPSTGEVVDPSRNNITTSEGVSYTMLRAVWIDDKNTFDKTFYWAQNNIQKKDKTFSWLYGQRPDGTFGVLTNQSGQNTASDADTNIALALIFASRRWSDVSYLESAREILKGIWQEEVVTIKGIPYLTADNLEKNNKIGVLLNPSYFEPYAYRIFAEVDSTHPWMEVVDSSYAILNKISDQLPPDWLTIDAKTGEILPNQNNILSTNFSYDALRVPWNISLDYEWFKDPRSIQYLSKLSVLEKNWLKNQKLVSNYSLDGYPASSVEIPAMYGGTLGYFMHTNPKLAEEIYQSKLLSRYSSDSNSWLVPLSYYDDNWAWFGVALYNHLIINLNNINS